MNELVFRRFRDLIYEHTGIFMQDDKRLMLSSRLTRTLRALDLTSFNAYYDLLQRSPRDSPGFCSFINSVTTNKTSFFREPHHFDFLANTVVPLMEAAQAGSSRRIRVWSAAVSTGQELYSIAITLLEALPDGGWNIDLVGSDIDTVVLAHAQRAVYPAESVAHLDPAFLSRYFLRGDGAMAGQVKLKPEVTSLAEFRRVNLMEARWPIDGFFDVIFFRNALIYFRPDIQEVFLRKMMRHLGPGGYLFIGNAEYIPFLEDILEPVYRTVYRMRHGGR